MKLLRAILFSALAAVMLPVMPHPQARADVYTDEGTHLVNGRQWRTTCDPYSQTERCRADIWATTVVQEGGRFVQRNGWVFNNLTYKPSPRHLWKTNPLGGNGVYQGKVAWTASDGRQWRTECDTAATGRNGCRSFAMAKVVESYLDSSGNRAYRWVTKWVFNNIVRFGPLETSGGTPPTPPPATPGVLMLPTGSGTVKASGLDNPWSLVFVGNQPVFTERDTRTISTIVNGRVLPVLTIAAVHVEAEGGLLGLAHSPGKLFVYYTTSSDNRVVSYTITGSGSSLQLTTPQVLVSGIPRARSHNGGRIAIGPDGMLYIGTGDAGDTSRSQNPNSLAGKILRVNPANGQPAPGSTSRVWTLGHRNVQGLAWADDGTMFASELGQNDWDELNVIRPGRNYGWPVVEGIGGRAGYTDPVAVWAPEVASPSGLLWRDQNLYMAALRGQRLWVMLDHDPAGTDTSTLQNGPGRLRDVVAAPDGTIWVLTSNNTDDRIIAYSLREA